LDLPSATEEGHTELLSDTAKPSIVAVPYPRSTRELSYETMGPSSKKRSRELIYLQIHNIHIAYINRQTKTDILDKEYLMLGAAFNSVAGFDDGSGIPKHFKDVLGHQNQKGFWESMKQEFNAMENKGVWEIVPMSSMPHGSKIVGNRWVYSKKSDGTLRSRIVAQGFSQVPGKDFTDSHAPVMTDLAFRLALIIKVLMTLHTVKYVMDTENLGLLLQPKLNQDGFYLEEFKTVNMLVTQILESVFMVLYYTSVEHQLHGNLKLGRVFLCHPLKLNIMLHQKLKRK
jgi:Reverse transcriptase (RNA-dependent DNA polymerase)